MKIEDPLDCITTSSTPSKEFENGFTFMEAIFVIDTYLFYLYFDYVKTFWFTTWFTYQQSSIGHGKIIDK